VICQSCGHDNPVANRFCGGCGAALVRTCPACGNSNPPAHRFCGKFEPARQVRQVKLRFGETGH